MLGGLFGVCLDLSVHTSKYVPNDNISISSVRLTLDPREVQTLGLKTVVFKFNRSFYPTTLAVPPVSFLILHPRDTNYVVTDSEKEK